MTARPTQRPAALSKFLKFAGIGIIGCVVDAVVLQAVMSHFAVSPYAAKAVSYLPAATTTWWLNRNLTFRETMHREPAPQWARFLTVNLIGGIVNYTVFAALVAALPLVALHPVIGVAAGSIAGLIFNFLLSKKFAFVA